MPNLHVVSRRFATREYVRLEQAATSSHQETPKVNCDVIRAEEGVELEYDQLGRHQKKPVLCL